MLLFLKNLYIKKLFYAALVLFLHCTLYKCNSIIPQVSTVEIWLRGLVMNCEGIVFNLQPWWPFWKLNTTSSNFNWCFLGRWSKETVSLTRAITENIVQCNIIFSDLEYFLKCYWSDCGPIANPKPKWVNPIRSISPYHWTMSFCRKD